MSACEKCWADAYRRSIATGYSQAYCYVKYIEERKDHPCTPREQAGDYWDEEKQCDRRDLDRCAHCLTIENGDCKIKADCKHYNEDNLRREIARREAPPCT